ncbi:MAG: hypothetical protein U1D55_10935 [Phycisphaerae bacterium]
MLALGNFFDWLSGLERWSLVLLTLSTAAVITLIGLGLAHAWRKVRESQHRADVTAIMLQRGMSSMEIARVLLAMQDQHDDEETPDDPEAAIAKLLLDSYYSGDDVTRVLAAARETGPIDTATITLVGQLTENWASTDSIVGVLRGRQKPGTPRSAISGASAAAPGAPAPGTATA